MGFGLNRRAYFWILQLLYQTLYYDSIKPEHYKTYNGFPTDRRPCWRFRSWVKQAVKAENLTMHIDTAELIEDRIRLK